MKKRVHRAVIEQNREGLDPLPIASVFVQFAAIEPGQPFDVEIPFGGEKVADGMVLRLGKDRYDITAAEQQGRATVMTCQEVASVSS